MTSFVANTNVLELIGLKSAIEGTFINDGAVKVTILDPAGAEVDGATWPLAMDYVGGSDGDYRAILTHELALVANQKYLAVIDANGGVNRIGRWEFPIRPAIRT